MACDFCGHPIEVNEIEVETLWGWHDWLKEEEKRRQTGMQRGGSDKPLDSYRPGMTLHLHIDCAAKLSMDIVAKLRYFIQAQNFVTSNVAVEKENEKAGKAIVASLSKQPSLA